MMVFTALVLLGGIRSIARVASAIVPIMIGFYLIAGLVALITQRGLLMGSLELIFKTAFAPPAAVGGALADR